MSRKESSNMLWIFGAIDRSVFTADQPKKESGKLLKNAGSNETR